MALRKRRKPLRNLRITHPVSPPAQNKTPGSRSFATPGFKWRGPHSVRTVEKRLVMTHDSLPEWRWCRNAVWVIETRDIHRLETTPASLDRAPGRNRTTALMRSHIDGADLDFVQSAKESRRILVRLRSLCNVDETRLLPLVRNANQISAARRYC